MAIYGCCYEIFKVLRLFISKPTVIKLRLQIKDNILHNRTVAVSSQVLIRQLIFNHQIAYTQQHQQQRRRRRHKSMAACMGRVPARAAPQRRCVGRHLANRNEMHFPVRQLRVAVLVFYNRPVFPELLQVRLVPQIVNVWELLEQYLEAVQTTASNQFLKAFFFCIILSLAVVIQCWQMSQGFSAWFGFS